MINNDSFVKLTRLYSSGATSEPIDKITSCNRPDKFTLTHFRLTDLHCIA